MKFNISVTDIETIVAQPPLENKYGTVNGQGAIVAEPQTMVPGITHMARNIFLKILKSNLIAIKSINTAIASHAKDAMKSRKKFSTIAKG